MDNIFVVFHFDRNNTLSFTRASKAISITMHVLESIMLPSKGEVRYGHILRFIIDSLIAAKHKFNNHETVYCGNFHGQT